MERTLGGLMLGRRYCLGLSVLAENAPLDRAFDVIKIEEVIVDIFTTLTAVPITSSSRLYTLKGIGCSYYYIKLTNSQPPHDGFQVPNTSLEL